MTPAALKALDKRFEETAKQAKKIDKQVMKQVAKQEAKQAARAASTLHWQPARDFFFGHHVQDLNDLVQVAAGCEQELSWLNTFMQCGRSLVQYLVG